MADIYILLGPEEGEKNSLIKRIRKETLESFPDTECYTFFVGDDDSSSYISAVSQSSLFASHRFIVLRGFENIKKTDPLYSSTLEAVKDNQSDLTLILVSSESMTSIFDKVLLDAAGKERTKIFWELSESEKHSWITAAVHREGFNITKDAVDEILSTVENNTEEMKNVVLSITNFLRLKNKTTIERDDIEAYTTASKGENGYTLFRALGEADLDKALRIIDSIIFNDPKNLLPAVSVAANQFRRIEEALRMREKRIPENTIFSELTAFSSFSYKAKSGVNFKEKDLFRTTMRNYTLSDVRNIILTLGKADTALKSAQTENLEMLGELLCYTIIVKKGKESPLTLSPLSLSPNPFI